MINYEHSIETPNKLIEVPRYVLWAAFVALSAVDFDDRDEYWEDGIAGLKAALNNA